MEVKFECCSNVSIIKSERTLRCGHYSVFTGVNFAISSLLLIKFFGFDLTPRCKDSVCKARMKTLKFSVSFLLGNVIWLATVSLFSRRRSLKTMCLLYKITVGIYITIHYVIYFLMFLDGLAEIWLLDENDIYRIGLAPQPMLIWLTIYMRRLEYAKLLGATANI